MFDSLIIAIIFFVLGCLVGCTKKAIEDLDNVESLNCVKKGKLKQAMDEKRYDYVYGYLEAIGDVIKIL